MNGNLKLSSTLRKSLFGVMYLCDLAKLGVIYCMIKLRNDYDAWLSHSSVSSSMMSLQDAVLGEQAARQKKGGVH